MNWRWLMTSNGATGEKRAKTVWCTVHEVLWETGPAGFFYFFLTYIWQQPSRLDKECLRKLYEFHKQVLQQPWCRFALIWNWNSSRHTLLLKRWKWNEREVCKHWMFEVQARVMIRFLRTQTMEISRFVTQISFFHWTNDFIFTARLGSTTRNRR